MRYEIYFITPCGDEFYTGDYFYDYEVALQEIEQLNENDDDRVYIVKECTFIRK